MNAFLWYATLSEAIGGTTNALWGVCIFGMVYYGVILTVSMQRLRTLEANKCDDYLWEVFRPSPNLPALPTASAFVAPSIARAFRAYVAASAPFPVQWPRVVVALHMGIRRCTKGFLVTCL